MSPTARTIDEENVGFKMHGDRKAQAGAHTGAVNPNRRIDELLDACERHDLIEGSVNGSTADLENSGCQVHILASGEERIEPEPVFAERGKASRRGNLAFSKAQRPEYEF